MFYPPHGEKTPTDESRSGMNRLMGLRVGLFRIFSLWFLFTLGLNIFVDSLNICAACCGYKIA